MTTQNTCKISHCEAIPTSGEYCERCAPSTPAIRYQTQEGCVRCTTDPYVPHFSCLYGGKAVGHSVAHCTASACY